MDDFRRGKLYDLLCAAPIAVWYGFATAGFIPRIATAYRTYEATDRLSALLSAVALTATVGFLALQIVLFLGRRPPQRISEDWISRIAAVAGANAGVLFLALPRIAMPPAIEALSAVLVIGGSIGSVIAAAYLGRSFSVLPQARKLVIAGPYRYIRHPLYLAEQIATFGVMLQFEMPWALLIAVASLALQFPRMHFEEKLLAQAYPEYRDYMRRTARLIPGVY